MSKRKIEKLLVCGGGFKFYYIYGSIKYLEEINILKNIKEYIGVSAGAMLSLLFAIGYNSSDLEKFFIEFEFDRLIDPHIDNLLENKGLDDGELLKIAIQTALSKSNIDPNITFSELYKITNKKLTFVAANVTKVKLQILDHVTEPDMPIWKGISITSALPIIYAPILHNGEYLIDGGAFDNYPIQLFQDESILGINLALQIKNIDLNIEFFNYMIKLYTIMHHWNNADKIDKYKKYTIEIPTYDATEIMNTCITIEEKRKRVKHGYDSAVKYFEDWKLESSEEEESNLNILTEEENKEDIIEDNEEQDEKNEDDEDVENVEDVEDVEDVDDEDEKDKKDEEESEEDEEEKSLTN